VKKQRYLLFDGGCSSCTAIARQVEQESNGWLTVKSLDDAEMRRLLDKHRPGWKFQPTLITVDGAEVTISTGISLSARIGAALGLRRAARVASLVMKNQSSKPASGANPTRRSVLRGVGVGAAALIGLAAMPGTASASEPEGDPDGEVLTGAALAEVLFAAKAEPSFQEALSNIDGLGFITHESEAVAFRATSGDTLLLSFHDSIANPGSLAALVAHEINADGSRRTVIEEIARDAGAGEDAGLEALSVRRLGVDGVQTMMAGPPEYFACMLGCVGVTCAGPATTCMRIPNLPAALACIAGVCGFKAYRCHRTCRHAW